MAPNEAGCWSDMSKATFFAAAIAEAVARVVASGYTLDGIFLLPVAKPPFAAQAAAAGGRAEEVHERLDRRGVPERDDRVAADLDRRAASR